MKNKLFLFLLTMLMVFSLTACGGRSSGSGDSSASMSIAADASNSYIDDGGVQDAMMSVEAGISSTESKTTATQQDNSIYDDSKLILNGRIIAEATDFDSAISAIEQQVLNAGGYIENSSVSGNIGDRWGMFTIRVPRGKFESVFEVVGENCHVTERSRSSENVSTTYYDTEARKTALETNRDRLSFSKKQIIWRISLHSKALFRMSNIKSRGCLAHFGTMTA